MRTEAFNCIENGKKYPYHDKEPESKAETIALAILDDLCDRCGIKHELQGVDPGVRLEIVEAMSDIIELGMEIL